MEAYKQELYEFVLAIRYRLCYFNTIHSFTYKNDMH